MILVDANLLLYAVNSDLEPHPEAQRWWQETLSGTEPVGLPWVVVLAFVRLTTHPRVFEHPLEVRAGPGLHRRVARPASRRCCGAGTESLADPA